MRTRARSEFWSNYWIPIALFAFVAIVLAVTIPLMIKWDNDYRAWCEAQGGHVDTHNDTQVTTTVTGNGQVGTGTSTTTTYYCLSADGRILDIS